VQSIRIEVHSRPAAAGNVENELVISSLNVIAVGLLGYEIEVFFTVFDSCTEDETSGTATKIMFWGLLRVLENVIHQRANSVEPC